MANTGFGQFPRSNNKVVEVDTRSRFRTFNLQNSNKINNGIVDIEKADNKKEAVEETNPVEEVAEEEEEDVNTLSLKWAVYLTSLFMDLLPLMRGIYETTSTGLWSETVYGRVEP